MEHKLKLSFTFGFCLILLNSVVTSEFEPKQKKPEKFPRAIGCRTGWRPSHKSTLDCCNERKLECTYSKMPTNEESGCICKNVEDKTSVSQCCKRKKLKAEKSRISSENCSSVEKKDLCYNSQQQTSCLVFHINDGQIESDITNLTINVES